MLILVIAVLGTTALVEGGMASTGRTKARQQGTSLARDLVERSRQIAYANTATAAAPAALRATLPASDNASALNGSAFTVKRNKRTYTVTVTSCTIDDPTDGAGVGNSTFCSANGAIPPGTGTQPTPTPTATPAAGVTARVLGVDVALGGSALGTVCGALGDPDLLQRLTTAVSDVAALSVCPDGGGGGGAGSIPFDDQPDDMRRVQIVLSWGSKDPESLVQTTLLTNPI